MRVGVNAVMVSMVDVVLIDAVLVGVVLMGIDVGMCVAVIVIWTAEFSGGG